jgi:hypothetical protein
MMKLDNRMRAVLEIAIAICAVGVFFYATKSFSSETSTGLDYFKGSWVVRMRSNPQQTFRWTVREDLRGGWLAGVVEQNGEKVSTDFWRQRGPKIERFAFTADGIFVKIESPGWVSERMILTGVASDKTGETKIRETITKVNDHQFHALWEREISGGKWTVFADEICTK